MRHRLILLVATALGACAPPAASPADPPAVEAAQDDRPARWAAEQRAYDAALAKAPTYRSDIRDWMIANPDAYRASSRGTLDMFRGRASEFGCIHPPASIAAAQRDDWQLVHCDRRSAYFFRERAEPDDCALRGPTVPHLFDTLRLVFAEGSDLEARRALFLMLTSNEFSNRPMTKEEATAITDAPLPDVDRVYSCVGPDNCLLFEEEAPARMVKMHFNPTGGCEAVPMAAKLVGSHRVSVQAPFADHGQAVALVEAASTYLAGL